MGIYCTHSIIDDCRENKEIIKKIYDKTRELRPAENLLYRPAAKTDYRQMPGLFWLNLDKFYPDYKEGDFVYLSAYADGLYEKEMFLNFRECSEIEVWFNGEKKELITDRNESISAPVTFNKGKNHILIKITAKKDLFGTCAEIIMSGLRERPVGYIYSSWFYIEKEGFKKQLGVEISRLYRRGETPPVEASVEWKYPTLPEQSNEKEFDFQKWCGKGKAAYAYTCVSGRIRITHQSPMRIFKNKTLIYSAAEGEFAAEFNEEAELLIKSIKHKNSWGFLSKTDGAHRLPFVDGADCPDLQWLWIGAFGREDDPQDYPYAPEINLQFCEPYTSICAGKIYWQFYREKTYLKQFLHSAFYGQWFYAIMIGHYGALQAAKMLKDDAFYKYFADSMKLICGHRNYGVFDNRLAEFSSYLPYGEKLDRLDPIGTIGMNISEYYMMSGDAKAEYLLQLLSDSMMYNVPRFPDGTFYRIETMWADDTYMCLPFLARLGAMTGEEKYFDEILTQVRGFYKRLYMEDENLFSHIYFVNEQKANRVPWGRGNGWILLSLSEVLLLMPENHRGRAEILGIFKKFALSLLNYRDKKYGVWHQVINNPESYIETSGSAMFITALARGVRYGWIESDYADDVSDAWNSLVRECIDSDGNVHGVCRGSGCNMEEKYYLKLGTIINDDHGVGIVIGAGVEVMSMLGES